MTVTFLVSIDVDDVTPSGLEGTASDVYDDLERSGQAVVEVKPWQRPTVGPLTPAGNVPEAPPPPPNPFA